MAMTLDQRNTWRPTLNSAVEAPVLHLLDKLLQARLLVETGDFLEQLPTPYPTDAEASTDTGEAGAPGRVIAGYELMELLGQGGMGSVWKARYADQRLQRQVAVKLPRWSDAWHSTSSQHLHQRMARERDILTALDHPNIARLLDAGVSEDGQPYLVLEWVDGQALDAYADEQHLSIVQRLSLMLQVLEAVDHAHRHLVLHRDIKPANILVNDEGQVKLLDFGVAKLLPPEDEIAPSQEDSLTRAQAPALTLAYASPEQLRHEPLSTASDVYACGVLLYRLLTGQLPYKPSRDSRAALEEAILTGQTQTASRAGFDEAASRLRGLAPSALSRQLRGDLDTLLSTALKPQALDRYASAKAMAQDIERYLHQEPLQARGDSAWYITRRWVQRHRWPVAAGVLVTTVVLASGGVAFQQARRAEAQAQSAQQASQRSAAAQQFLSGILALTDPEKNRHITEYDQGLLDHAFKTASTQFATEPETLAVILQQLGDIYSRQGEPQRHLEVQRERWRLVGLAHGIDPGLRLDALADLGLALLDSGNAADSDMALQRLQEGAVLARDPLLPLSAVSRVRALGYLAAAHKMRQRHTEASQVAHEALKWGQAQLPNPHPFLAFAHHAVAVTSADLGDMEQARRAFALADAIDQSGQGRGVVDQVNNLILWAQAEFQAGEYPQAGDTALRAIARGERELGSTGGILTPARSVAVNAILRQGQVVRAKMLADELFKADLVSTDAFRAGRAHATIGMVATAAGDFDEAQRALQWAEAGLKPDPYWRSVWHKRWSQLWLMRGQTGLRPQHSAARALLHAEQSVSYFNREQSAEGRDAGLALQLLGVAQARTGQIDAARSSLAQGCLFALHKLPPTHSDHLRCEAYTALLKVPGSEGSMALAELSTRKTSDALLARDLVTAMRWLQRQTAQPDWQTFPYLN